MFIKIDDDHSIDSETIISILDYQLLNSSEKMRSYMERNKLSGLVYGDEDEAKSIIITDDIIYYSPFSTFSLKRKLNKSSIINKLEDYSTSE